MTHQQRFTVSDTVAKHLIIVSNSLDRAINSGHISPKKAAAFLWVCHQSLTRHTRSAAENLASFNLRVEFGRIT